MPIIQIKPFELLSPRVPKSLAELLEQPAWHAIFVAYDDSVKEISCRASAQIFFTCSWCCQDHVRWSLLNGSGLPGRLHEVNNKHFMTRNVVQTRDNHIIVQTDYLIELQRQQLEIQSHTTTTATAAGYEQIPIVAPPHQNQYHQQNQQHQQQYQPVPQAFPPPAPVPQQQHQQQQLQQQQRSLDVIVPPGAPPGSVLSVQDANGQIVQVTVPPGVEAGMRLEFSY